MPRRAAPAELGALREKTGSILSFAHTNDSPLGSLWLFGCLCSGICAEGLLFGGIGWFDPLSNGALSTTPFNNSKMITHQNVLELGREKLRTVRVRKDAVCELQVSGQAGARVELFRQNLRGFHVSHVWRDWHARKLCYHLDGLCNRAICCSRRLHRDPSFDSVTCRLLEPYAYRRRIFFYAYGLFSYLCSRLWWDSRAMTAA